MNNIKDIKKHNKLNGGELYSFVFSMFHFSFYMFVPFCHDGDLFRATVALYKTVLLFAPPLPI